MTETGLYHVDRVEYPLTLISPIDMGNPHTIPQSKRVRPLVYDTNEQYVVFEKDIIGSEICLTPLSEPLVSELRKIRDAVENNKEYAFQQLSDDSDNKFLNAVAGAVDNFPNLSLREWLYTNLQTQKRSVTISQEDYLIPKLDYVNSFGIYRSSSRTARFSIRTIFASVQLNSQILHVPLAARSNCPTIFYTKQLTGEVEYIPKENISSIDCIERLQNTSQAGAYLQESSKYQNILDV